MNIKYSHFFALALGFVLFSCSKQEGINLMANESNGDITGQWNLVLSSGGRVLPKTYIKGTEIWSFENHKLTQSSYVYNTITVSDYSIVDTLGGNQLKLDDVLFANIEVLTNDSLVLHVEKFIGCGGSYFFVR